MKYGIAYYRQKDANITMAWKQRYRIMHSRNSADLMIG
jgi:hypothetical protein